MTNRFQTPPNGPETAHQAAPEGQKPESPFFSTANNPFLASWQAWLQQNSAFGEKVPSAEAPRETTQSTTATDPQNFSEFRTSQDQTPSFWPFWANPWLNTPLGGAPWGTPSANPFSPPDPTAMLRAFEPEEIEKKIQELKVVMQWLTQIQQNTQWTVQWLTWQKEAMSQLKTSAAAESTSKAPAKPKG